MKRLLILCIALSIIYGKSLTAQKKDTVNYYPLKSNNKYYPFEGNNRTTCRVPIDTIGKQSRFLKGLIAPTALIGYGLTTLKNHGLYSSFQADKAIDRIFPNDKSTIDNFLVFSPYVEFLALLSLKVKNKDDLINTCLLIAKAEIMMAAIVFPMKYIAHEERPYSYELGQAGVPLSERKKDKQAFVSMPSNPPGGKPKISSNSGVQMVLCVRKSQSNTPTRPRSGAWSSRSATS